MDDVGAVAEEVHVEPHVGHARDRPLDDVVDAVEGIHLAWREGEVQRAWDRDHEKEPGEHGAEEHDEGQGEQVAVERPVRQRRVVGG